MNSDLLLQWKTSVTYINECCYKSEPYGRESEAACSLSISMQVHCCPKHSTHQEHIIIITIGTPHSISCLTHEQEVGQETEGVVGELRGQWRRDGQRKVKGEGRTGNELERDHERQKRRKRLREREGAVPRATTALSPHSHPCVTSPCCKLGYTCSLEMSEHVSWRLAWICIGALWSFFNKIIPRHSLKSMHFNKLRISFEKNHQDYDFHRKSVLGGTPLHVAWLLI